MYAAGIVTYLNAVFRSNLTGKQFQQGRFFGIAKKVIRQGSSDGDKTPFQVIFDDEGIDSSDLVNDKYSIAVYHRCNSFSYYTFEQNQKNSFGDEANVKGMLLNMVLVVYGDRKRLHTTNEELCTRFYLSFPSVLPPAASGTLLGVKSASFNPQTGNNISQGSGSVADQEGLTIEPENILFSINYQINLLIDSGCTDCITYCEWSDCVAEVRTCSPVLAGTQFLTFYTVDNVSAYLKAELHNKTIQFVLGERMRLTENVEWTFNNTTNEFNYIDPVNTPVVGGQPITIAYK